MQHTKCYKKDYPRPQFVRNNWMNLNGTWDFAFDDEDVGMEKKYYKNFFKISALCPITLYTIWADGRSELCYTKGAKPNWEVYL